MRNREAWKLRLPRANVAEVSVAVEASNLMLYVSYVCRGESQGHILITCVCLFSATGQK